MATAILDSYNCSQQLERHAPGVPTRGDAVPGTAVPQDPALHRPLAARTRADADRVRATGVLATAALLGAAGLGALATSLPVLTSTSSPATTAEDLLVALAAGLGGALAATWAVAAAAMALGQLAPTTAGAAALSRTAQRLLPAVLRGLLVVALGAGPVAAAGPALAAVPLASDVVPPAATTSGALVASPAALPGEAGRASSTAALPPSVVAVAPEVTTGPQGAPDVTWRPSAPPRPTSAAVDAAGSLVVPPPRVADDARERAGQVVVVVRGDTLWDIARRWLPAGADDGEVAAAWPAWYAANRAVIGEDPDLLLPGQRLVPPERTATPAGTLR